MDKTLKEAIDFINEWGIGEGNYIAYHIKNFMDSNNNVDDNSCELADIHHEQLQIVIEAGLNTDKLLQQAKKDVLKKVAHFDMLKEIGVSVEDIVEIDYEDFEDIYLSLPSLIAKNICEGFLERSEIIELLKDVKIKSKKLQELIDDKQIPVFN